jgi:hypothetical protein
MPSEAKIAWVAGYMDAAALWEAEAESRGDRNSLAAMIPLKLTVGEVVESLNQFYAEPTNRRIKIIFALDWVREKAAGTDEESLRRYAESLRRDADK